jgi:hypothetical protein
VKLPRLNYPNDIKRARRFKPCRNLAACQTNQSPPCRPEAGKQWQHLLKTNKRINTAILRFNAIYTLLANTH